jgi:hypothetical protein
VGKVTGALLVAALATTVACGSPESQSPAQRSEPERTESVKAPDWPPLPTRGFIRGRSATDQDVKEGNAVFVAARQGKAIAEPISIDIPQYAIYTNPDTKEQRRVIIVQAERTGGIEMIGYIDLTGNTNGVGMLTEFLLLGKTPGSRK